MTSDVIRQRVATAALPATAGGTRDSAGFGQALERLTLEGSTNALLALLMVVAGVAFFVTEGQDPVNTALYAGFAAWFALLSWNLRRGADESQRYAWLRRSLWASGTLAGLALLSLPMSIADRDVACMVASSLFVIAGSSVGLVTYLKTR